jgi:hypothetical protein
LQANGDVLITASAILEVLFSQLPDCIRTAIDVNITTGLVRIVREVLLDPNSFTTTGSNITLLRAPVTCLRKIMWTNSTAKALQPLVDPDFVRLLPDLVPLAGEDLIIPILQLVRPVVSTIGVDKAWEDLGRLAREIAGLVTAEPPVQPGLAANMLSFMAFHHEELLEDYRSWDMGPGLNRLTTHKDPGTRSAVKQLLLIIERGVQVSSALLHTNSFKILMSTYLLPTMTGQLLG